MKRTTALLFLVVFSGLCVYFYFAEEICPLHSAPLAGSTFSHTHQALPAICLCFWGTLFAPRTFDFCCYQGVERLPARPNGLSPLKAYNADIAHPPRALSS
jgi:hypothetical protein